MVGFEEQKSELEALDVKVVAASVDTPEKAQEVADEVAFPIAYGVTHDIAEKLDSWWEGRRGIIQPSEFIVGRDGKIIHSSYSSGPLARTQARDVVGLLKLLIKYQK